MMIAAMDAAATLLSYLQAESFLIVYESFGLSESSASLAQIAVIIGCLLSVLPRWYDHRLLIRLRRGGRGPAPEDKLFGFALAAPTLAVGLWWFAWTIPPRIRIHWAPSMLSLILTGFAVNEFVYTLSGYLADSYTTFAASAFAGMLLTRSLLTAAVVQFTYQMYTNISANDATSILAAFATAFCVAPYILIRHGKRIREASKFCSYSLDANQHNAIEEDE